MKKTIDMNIQLTEEEKGNLERLLQNHADECNFEISNRYYQEKESKQSTLNMLKTINTIVEQLGLDVHTGVEEIDNMNKIKYTYTVNYTMHSNGETKEEKVEAHSLAEAVELFNSTKGDADRTYYTINSVTHY